MQALPSKRPNPSAFDGMRPPFYSSVLFFDSMNALGSFFWGIGFAATGPIMIGSLVADREKGLRHQLQMTGLAHRA